MHFKAGQLEDPIISLWASLAKIRVDWEQFKGQGMGKMHSLGSKLVGSSSWAFNIVGSLLG